MWTQKLPVTSSMAAGKMQAEKNWLQQGEPQMSATMTISNLSAEAAKLASEAEELQKEFQQKTADLKARYPWANFNEFDLGSTDGGTATKTAPKTAPKRRGRPKAAASTPTVAATPTAKKRGRPKGSKNKKVVGKVVGKVKPNERNYDNEISLREAIWQILDMGPDIWAEHLSDLPEEAEGLKAAEIRDMIEITKIWQSSSDNIAPQVQQHLHKLKGEEKIARGDDRRYYIVEGAEL